MGLVGRRRRAELDRLRQVRWLMWVLGALVYFEMIFERSSASAIADRFMADFAVGASALGLLGGLQLLTYTLMQVPAGAFADWLGPRRMLGAGALLAGLGTLLFSLAPLFPLAVGGRVLLGLGDSLVFLNVLRLQAEWFRPREYATLAGLTALAGGLGGLSASAPLALLVERFGWRAPLAASGLALLATSALCWWLVRDRPSGYGLPGWGELEPPGPTDVAPAPPAAGRRGSVLGVAANPQTWWAALAHLGLFGPFLALTTVWGIPYLMHVYGFDRPTAGGLMGLVSLGYFLSGPLLGYLSDRLGRRRLLILATDGVTAAIWLTLATQHRLPLPWLAALLLLAGTGAGGCLLAFAAVKEANPPGLSGLATGFTNLGGFSGGAVLLGVIGWLLDRGWTGQAVAGARVYPPEAYGTALLALCAAAALGSVGALRLRR